MGLFDEVKGAAEQMGGQNMVDGLVQQGTQQAEQFIDQKTGGQFNSEIQSAGNFADQQIDQQFGGQGNQGQGQSGQQGQGFSGQQGQGQGQGQSGQGNQNW